MLNLALPGRGRLEESEPPVYLTVAVALAIGLCVQWTVVGRMQTASVGSGTIAYPSSWQRVAEEGALFAAADRNHGTFGTRVSVRELPKSDLLPGEGTLVDAATNWSLRRGQELVGYRILSITEGIVNGREAAMVDYAYLASSAGGSADGTMPGLMHAIDTLVLGGETYQVLTFAAESHEFPAVTNRQAPLFRNVYQDVLTNWRAR
jgi:hypothetical protein